MKSDRMRFFPRSKVPRLRAYWTKVPSEYLSCMVRYTMYFNDKGARGLLMRTDIFHQEEMKDRVFVAQQLRRARAEFRAEVSGINGHHPERWT